MNNRLYYGDNLEVLREEIRDESVDLIYLDPPFNSNRAYNLLFKTPKGHESDAQITAFEDTWHWGQQAEAEFREIIKSGNTDVAEMMQALRKFLGENDMMAYLTMMANRLLEMHRVLKATGSIYLHCDPTASHFLKIVLDGVFGSENFRTEISWKRQSAHSDAKQGRKQYGNVRDVIFFYTKSDEWTWNWQYTPYSKDYIESFYKFVELETGRRYRLSDLTAPGGASPEKRNPKYEFLGVIRYWRYTKENMENLYREGRIVQTGPGRVPAYKRYLDEMPGVPLQNDWDDIGPASGSESLGYPTQKPLALLERIILTSSNEGDIVLDPFCGCGTAVHAAQKLNRRWIGIDITHLAVSLIEKRLKSAFPYLQVVTHGSKKAAQAGPNSFEVIGVPHDLDAAHDLAKRDPHQFQLWACTLVGAQPYKGGQKGADKGIDGVIFAEVGKGTAEKIIISVKAGENVGVAMVRDLKGVVGREKAAIGMFITLTSPTREMVKEATAAGFYESPHHGEFPKIQILTIEGLLSGNERPKYPDMTYGGQTFKKAKKENQAQEQKQLF